MDNIIEAIQPGVPVAESQMPTEQPMQMSIDATQQSLISGDFNRAEFLTAKAQPAQVQNDTVQNDNPNSFDASKVLERLNGSNAVREQAPVQQVQPVQPATQPQQTVTPSDTPSSDDWLSKIFTSEYSASTDPASIDEPATQQAVQPTTENVAQFSEEQVNAINDYQGAVRKNYNDIQLASAAKNLDPSVVLNEMQNITADEMVDYIINKNRASGQPQQNQQVAPPPAPPTSITGFIQPEQVKVNGSSAMGSGKPRWEF